MDAVFYLTFSRDRSMASSSEMYWRMTEWWTELFTHVNTVVLHGLVIDCIFSGVGSVLSFLPIIVTLFFFLSMMEDSGYNARVAFFMDKLLRKIGLSEHRYMLIGFHACCLCSDGDPDASKRKGP